MAVSRQGLTREEAIRIYTTGGAWQDHMENAKGSVEAGKLADFSVIDKDILTIVPNDISNIQNLMTIVGGNIVYNAVPDYLYYTC